MASILFVKANNRPVEESITVKLYESFLQSYRKAHPEDEIIELDLHQENIPYLGDVMIRGLGKHAKGEPMTEQEQSQVETANRLLDQFIDADKVVLAFPLWNLTVPAVLHAYLDCMHRPRKTFRYTKEGPIGLLSDKKVALLHASGGELSPGDQDGLSLRFVQKHLHFFGISNLTKVVIHGHHQYPEQSEEIIERGLSEAANAAITF